MLDALPLQLDKILIQWFAGDATAYLFIALIIVSVFAARTRMPMGVFAVLLIVFLLISIGASAYGLGGAASGFLLMILMVLAILAGKWITDNWR